MSMKTTPLVFPVVILCLSLLATGSMAAAAPSGLPADSQEQYDMGVTAYRNGQYDKALPVFRRLTKAQPGCIECHYYQGISATQLKHYQEARLSYDTVIELSPNSDAAELARRGLQYLPQPNALDEPPEVLDSKGSPIRRAFQRAKNFVKSQTSDDMTAPSSAASSSTASGYTHPALARQPKPSAGWEEPDEASLPGGGAISTKAARQSMNADPYSDEPVTPKAATSNAANNNDQMMKRMQMMMMMNASGGNGNNGGGFNPMMLNMMESMDGNSQHKLAPDVMSQLMMNQMTGQLDMFKNNNNDNN